MNWAQCCALHGAAFGSIPGTPVSSGPEEQSRQGQICKCEHGWQSVIYWHRTKLITLLPCPLQFSVFCFHVFSLGRTHTHTSNESLSCYTPIPREAERGLQHQTLLQLFFLYKADLQLRSVCFIICPQVICVHIIDCRSKVELDTGFTRYKWLQNSFM